ncbi:CRTAC1 family protein [Acidobacteria bacterium AH-259-O06]|nr:CRTAC1 family protein [Acidobacteria bacterium AH-259-O06]
MLKQRKNAWYKLVIISILMMLGSGMSALILAQSTAPLTQKKAPVVSNPTSASREAMASHRKMLMLLQNIKERTPDEHPYHGEANARRLRAELAAMAKGEPIDAFFPEVTRWLLYVDLGEEELLLGNERQAIDHLSNAYQLLPKVQDKLRPDLPIILSFRLGVAHIRLGETQNCCLRETPQSCILPIREGGIHTNQEGSKQAIKYFTQVLEHTGERSDLHLQSRWLLSIAYMTIGGYPDAVPPPYVIPPEAFEPDEKFPRFTNIASRLGLNTFSLSGGAIADDFNNDGHLDLFVSTWDTAGQIRFFVNNRDGTFSDRTKEAGLVGLYGGLNILQADYDNDGDVDILVLRGAWLAESGQHPNSLLRNNADGTFSDVTFEVGLGDVHYPTQTAAWADYDNDGDLDLYIGNESSHQQPIFFAQQKSITGKQASPCQLFLNSGDGTFTDVAKQAGVTNDRFTKSVVWGDYDGDRFPDLYVSNFQGSNRLYHNNGDGTFTDLAVKLGVAGPKFSFPAWFWDFDNDGVLDLFVSAYSAGIEHVAADYLGLPFETELARLYRGKGHGEFEDVTRQQKLNSPNAPMGSNFGDIDNDGFLDFYLGTGYPDYEELMPNVMYYNRGGTSFADVTTAAGFGHLQKGHAVVFADFDNDGDQDIFEQMGGAFRGDRFYDAFYENPGFGNHWISVKLIGVQSNRSAIGARIRVDVVENGKQRAIYKSVNSGGSFGANPLRQTIGLGKVSKIERLEVYWPTTGQTQVFVTVRMDEFIKIVEGQDHYTTLPLRKYRLGHRSK